MQRGIIRKSRFLWPLLWISLSTSLLPARPAWADRGGEADVQVDCNGKDGSITKALGSAHGVPITISVTGSCHENVVIQSPHVTLITTSGASVEGSEQTLPAIAVRQDDVLIDGFTVTGGFQGISALNVQRLTVQNCTVEGMSDRGILLQSSGVTIDHCMIRNNGFGVTGIKGSTYVLTNSVISGNAFTGVQANFGTTAYIGLDFRGNLAGNRISGNVGTGIQVAGNGFALIAGNTIDGNASTSNPAFGQAGIGVFEANANIIGANTISNNGLFGIQLRAAHLLMGFNTPFHVADSVNSIVGNGAGANSPPGGGAGISAFLGSMIEMRNATISNNTGTGLAVTLQSSIHGVGTTINSNSGDGVQLSLGSSALLQDPQVMVSGNGRFGLNCLDAESRVAGDIAGIIGNKAANLSRGCTGF